MHPLDRPIWASLTTHLAEWAEGGALAKRFQRGVNAFASTSDDESPQALQALADLVLPGEQVYLAQAAPLPAPPGLVMVKAAPGVQMLSQTPVAAADDGDVLELG